MSVGIGARGLAQALMSSGSGGRPTNMTPEGAGRSGALNRTSTMKLEFTMTIEPRIIVSDNAFIKNDGIVFPPPSAPITDLAALTYVSSVTSDMRQKRLSCLALASRRVSDVLPNYRLWLLASQGAWQPDTKRMRALKLWRWLANGGMKTPAGAKGAEVAREHSHGIKWFSFAEVEEDELQIVHDIVSAEQTSFLVAAPRSPAVDEYLAAGWDEGHPGVMTFWRDMALVTSRARHLLLRPFGNFDDVEAGVNVIGAPETIAMLKEHGSVA